MCAHSSAQLLNQSKLGESLDLSHNTIRTYIESFAIEMILSELKDWTGYFYRTSHGAEIDLILEKGMEKVAIEFKSSTSPSVSKGFYISLEDLKIDKGWVICPISESYPLNNNISVSGINDFIIFIKGRKA